MITPLLTFGQVLDAPGGREVLERYLPAAVAGPTADLRPLMLQLFHRVTPALRDPETFDRFWAEVDEVMGPVLSPRPVSDRAAPADPDRNGLRATAPWTLVGEPTRWGTLEIALEGPVLGNPFVDVELSVEFRCRSHSWTIGGFYAGDGIFRVRVLAEEEGDWRFVTASNVPALDGVRGEMAVGPAAPDAHGPVRVDGFHFAYADGMRYRPWGTTAYAWNHQDDEQQRATLQTLAASPFTKLRMCLFPKHFVYNTEEPARFPFPPDADGTFDVSRFNLDVFAGLDEQIRRLGELGVQVDLILFHPYDRWGFTNLGPTVDDRLVRYVVRRLAGFPHVWFSLANEYDLLFAKSMDDWVRLGELVSREDPHGHLLSVHNCVDLFDHGQPWVTHASIQRATVEETSAWRDRWGKPVVIDECGYEGDLEYDWGNLSGEELLRRCWEGAVRGGYVGHGETYWDPEDRIWWSKGGRLLGTCPDPIGFLAHVVADSPTGVLEPLPSDFAGLWAGVTDRYLVSYTGVNRPRERTVLLPPGCWQVEVLDTWDCTVHRLPDRYETLVRVPMPAKPYQAIRLVAV